VPRPRMRETILPLPPYALVWCSIKKMHLYFLMIHYTSAGAPYFLFPVLRYELVEK